MKDIFDKYVETSLGEKEQAKFKFKQFEFNYKKFFPENSDAKVLDIGIGRGEMLSCMKNWDYEDYLGIDISKSTVEFCSSINLNCMLVSNTIEWLSNHPKTFDVITILDVIEHFKKEDTLNLLKALKGALRDNGVLIIQTPNMQAVDGQLHRYNDFTHEFGYTEHSLKQILDTVDFNNIEIFGFEENVFGGFRAFKRNFNRSIIWKITRFNRRMTGNLNPKILHPVFYAKVRK